MTKADGSASVHLRSLPLPPHCTPSTFVCRLETSFVAIDSAQESIWNFGSGWPSVADIVIRACERVPKVRIFM